MVGPIFGPNFLAPKRWPPQRLVGPDGGASPKQPIEVFGRGGWQGFWQENSLVGEVGGEKRLEEVGGPKAWREKGSGREKAASPPYTLCRPPPCSKLVWRGASRPWLGPEVGRATGATFSLQEGGRGRAVPQRKKALGAHGPEPHA